VLSGRGGAHAFAHTHFTYYYNDEYTITINISCLLLPEILSGVPICHEPTSHQCLDRLPVPLCSSNSNKYVLLQCWGSGQGLRKFCQFIGSETQWKLKEHLDLHLLLDIQLI
jgi:hypothetical protein